MHPPAQQTDLSALGEVDIIDGDGYPTDEALDLIRHWTGTPEEMFENLLVPIFAAYGGAEIQRATDLVGREVVGVCLVTGGWSGCESAIGAIKSGLFGVAWWRESNRGGRHVYEIPAPMWSEPMVAWDVPTGYEAEYHRGLVDGRAASNIAQAALLDQIREVVTDKRLLGIDGRHIAKRILALLDEAREA